MPLLTDALFPATVVRGFRINHKHWFFAMVVSTRALVLWVSLIGSPLADNI